MTERTHEVIYAEIRYDLKDIRGSYRSYLYAGDEPIESNEFMKRRVLVAQLLDPDHPKVDFTQTELGLMLTFPQEAEKHKVPEAARAAFTRILPLLEEVMKLPPKAKATQNAPVENPFTTELAVLAKELYSDMTNTQYVYDYHMVKTEFPQLHDSLMKIVQQDTAITPEDLDRAIALPSILRNGNVSLTPTFLADYNKYIIPRLEKLKELQMTPQETALADALDKFWHHNGAKLFNVLNSMPSGHTYIGFHRFDTTPAGELSKFLEAGRTLNGGAHWVDYKTNMTALRKMLTESMGPRPTDHAVYGPFKDGERILKKARDVGGLNDVCHLILGGAVEDFIREVKYKIDPARQAVQALSQQGSQRVA